MAKERIIINDVGPRDGLQNQPKILSVEDRVRLVSSLIEAGIPEIEVGAFVSPKAVPAMAGTDRVFAATKDLSSDVTLSALIPNKKGLELAQKAGVQLSSLVMAASSTMNQKNIRMSNADTIAMIRDVMAFSRQSQSAAQDKTQIQAYLATAWECPFEGKVKPTQVLNLAGELMDTGIESLVIADTIGAANPMEVKNLMQALINDFGSERLSCHFHDTRAMGIANVYAAIEAGVRKFDASIAGLGGCPFAPGASGNVATEDVVLLVEQMGFETGIDMTRLLEASDLAELLTGTATGGNSKNWLRKKYVKAGQ